MKESIIKQMSDLVDRIMVANQTDFTKYDVEALDGYDGRFFWFVAPYHTRLCKVSHQELSRMVESEIGLYLFIQHSTSMDSCLDCHTADEQVFMYDGAGLTQWGNESVRVYWESLRDWTLLQWQAYHGMEPLPSDFTIPIEFNGCEDYYKEQLEYASQHNDTSLKDIMDSFGRFLKKGSDHKIVISRDFTDRSFTFAEYYGGRFHLCGGIIFHGYPDEGYMENCSVQLTPSYGWSRHT